MALFKRLVATAVMGMTLSTAAFAENDPIKIALIHGLSGSSFEAFSKQAQTGFEMGIEYGTGGTGEINGRPIELIIKDTQFKPDIARAVLAEAYSESGETERAEFHDRRAGDLDAYDAANLEVVRRRI